MFSWEIRRIERDGGITRSLYNGKGNLSLSCAAYTGQEPSPYSRDRRMNPTKTVYVVYYAADDGSGYQWSEQTSSKSSGQKIVANRQPVERRVLNISSENIYITVEPDQTAESYTAELGQQYRIIMILSEGYLLIYAAAWGVILVQKKKREKG